MDEIRKRSLKEWNDITKSIQADIVVMGMPLLDTTQFKDSLGTFFCRFSFADPFLDGRGGTSRIRKRQCEGIDLALQNEVGFGHPKATLPEGFEQIYFRWKSGEITVVYAMRETGVKKKTSFYKLHREYERLD